MRSAKLINIYFFSLFNFFLLCLFVFSFNKCSEPLHSRHRNVFTNKIVHELYKLWQGEAACSKAGRILMVLSLCHTGVWKAESTVCHRKPNAALKPTTWQLSTQPSILHFLSREITAEYRLTPCWVKALICLHCSNSSSADPVWHGCHPTARSNPGCRWAGIAVPQQGAVWDKGTAAPDRQDALTEGQGNAVHWQLPQKAVGPRGLYHQLYIMNLSLGCSDNADPVLAMF